MKQLIEHKAAKQAKEIFNNSYLEIVEHFDEETNELLTELGRNEIKKDRVVDELSDVCYMINQIAALFNTDYKTLLENAMRKNEPKRGIFYDNRTSR